jgi:hypothetical protein
LAIPVGEGTWRERRRESMDKNNERRHRVMKRESIHKIRDERRHPEGKENL